MSENLRKAVSAGLLIGVGATAFITILRQYSTAFMMVEPSREYALVAAFMVVGIMALTLLLPTTPAIRFAFWTIAAAIVTSVAVAVAPRLGLIEHSPLNWRYAVLMAIVSPFAGLLALAWGAKAKAPKVSESERGASKVTTERKRKQVAARRPPQSLSAAKAPKELANPDGAGDDATAAEITKWLETLTVFVDKGGNRAETARELNMTPPGVSHHLHKLYEVEPELMQRKAPEWVERNIKD